MNSKFIDELAYTEEADFVGDYHTGRTKRYQRGAVSGATLWIWYDTDLNGVPLRFAEVDSTINKLSLFEPPYGYLTGTNFPFLWSDYDPESWKIGDAAVEGVNFAVPDICAADQRSAYCGAPVNNAFQSDEFSKAREGKEFWPVCAFSLHEHFTRFTLSTKIICDVTTGMLIHNGVNNSENNDWKQVYLEEGCSEYTVLSAAAVEHAEGCVPGGQCAGCMSAPRDVHLARVAVDGATCRSVGPACKTQ
eukprot:NODE_8928_length_1459_cov_4.497748.p1 GENE.NODE_8928_length_1459_cov_4.497748~~NODE_8928_length_1459_cov_4.497748.p1  ORF type:complete len:248 (+),score=58.27 NODE_8928_length_1459_cov_4.497748:694-1437(+)